MAETTVRARPEAPALPTAVAASGFLLFFVLGATTASLGASLPFLADRFGAEHQVGRVVTWYNLGALLCVALIGLLGRRLPAKSALGGALALFVLGAAGMAASGSWTAFAVSAAVTGCGYGGAALLLNTAFARGFADDSVVMVNRLNAVFGIGAILGPLAIGAIGRTNIQTFPLIACLAALPCALAYRAGGVLRQPGPAGPSTGGGLGRPQLAAFLVLGLLYAGMETSIGTWEATQLVRGGWSDGAAVQAVAGFWGGIALGRLVVPQLARRVSAQAALPVCLAVALAGLLLAAAPHAALPAYPLVGFAVAPVLPTLIAWISGVAAVPQRVTSLLSLACMLGNAVVPAVVGAAVGAGRAELVPLSLAAVCVLCLLAALAVRRLTAADSPA
ncbi:MFS transporter [Kitasatospora sp. McL0602]|uniref:MFS transporter n=1 Tax=Kitasatospora sp. McL0602 TaxID=3439530 RepID=UPI003F88D796